MASVKVAVEELIAEKGRDRVTIPMIAERAGVQPSSVYRRWGDLPTMINDIVTYHLDPDRPLARTGAVEGDLRSWARELVEHYRNPVNAALLRGGAASAGEEETNCLRNRRTEASAIVARYTEDEAVTADAVVDHVVAPIIYRAIFSPWTLDETTADRLVDDLYRR